MYYLMRLRCFVSSSFSFGLSCPVDRCWLFQVSQARKPISRRTRPAQQDCLGEDTWPRCWIWQPPEAESKFSGCSKSSFRVWKRRRFRPCCHNRGGEDLQVVPQPWWWWINRDGCDKSWLARKRLYYPGHTWKSALPFLEASKVVLWKWGQWNRNCVAVTKW